MRLSIGQSVKCFRLCMQQLTSDTSLNSIVVSLKYTSMIPINKYVH